MLLEVQDWKGLASELDIGIGDQNAISSKCKDDAKCHRRYAVQKYCDASGLAVEVVAENIAQALESMGHKKQANIIRNMFPAGGKSAGKCSLQPFFKFIINVYNTQVMSIQILKKSHTPRRIVKEDRAMASKHHTTMIFERLLSSSYSAYS